MKILIIEDNLRLAEKISRHLHDWFIVDTASTGHEGLLALSTNPYNAIILDLNLPDMHGLEVCRRIRAIPNNTPVLILTGIDDTLSKIDLLDSGADDYMTKPFNSKELQARINALIRRESHRPHIPLLQAEDIVLDPARRVVTRGSIPIKLRRKEFDILEYLILHKGQVVTREMLIHHAWSSQAQRWTGSVDVHMKHLRDKIDKPFSKKLIKTIYAIGYTIESSKDN